MYYTNKKNDNKKYNNNIKIKVVIKSNHIYRGQLCFGEYLIPGKSKSEILISTYICHPSMANNELSGPIVSMSFNRLFQKNKQDKSLKICFFAETIGSIAYLNKNQTFKKINRWI